MAKLIHLIYTSKASVVFSEDDISNLLTSARKNNELLDVTGILLFDGVSFMQVLEGEEEIVNSLFASITNDYRHYNIVKILSESLPDRKFKEWSMGYALVTEKELSKIEGFNDFFQDQTCLAELDKSRAKKILTAFEKGRWRFT